jgi:hypothetical protein
MFIAPIPWKKRGIGLARGLVYISNIYTHPIFEEFYDLSNDRNDRTKCLVRLVLPYAYSTRYSALVLIIDHFVHII